jgi:hypothetical protein
MGKQRFAARWLVYGAKRLGQSIVTGAVCGRRSPGISRSNQVYECLMVKEWKVAREYQPGGLRVLRLGCEDACDGSKVFLYIYDLCEAGAHGIVNLIGAHGDECSLDVGLEE